MPTIVWTDYLRYRASLRGFDLSILEVILRQSNKRYFDTETGRKVAVGRHKELLILIPYDQHEATITPVTVHAITRQQIRYRLMTGKFTYE